MKPMTTRTLNPLPFQDLEPHRFEDLVRQLAYDLRSWRSLEATGRSGTDEGLDIRATEATPAVDDATADGDEGDDATEPPAIRERLWIFQCKRERSLAAKRVRVVVKESLASLERSPHGFVLAIACDVSKKTRDAFREEMVARGIEEFALWAKGELEDMLFQPKNDRLLFAYFGISLTPRRRTMTTALRASLARKKQLAALLAEDQHHGRLVLLRDPSDERYPHEPVEGEPLARWKAFRALHLKSPGHLLVLDREHLAALTPSREKWDAILDYNVATLHAENDLRGRDAWGLDDRQRHEHAPHDFWNEYIPERERAYLKIFRFVPLDRILGIDPLGDGFFPVPHIFVEFDAGTGPFSERELAALELAGMRGAHIELRPDKANRTEIFPKTLPGADELPPVGFDDTILDALPLSDAAAVKFASLLKGVEQGRLSAVRLSNETERAEAQRLRMQPFEEWRDRIALPLFSGFVSRLRAAGHTARVVRRSVDPDHGSHEAFHSVELRVQCTSEVCITCRTTLRGTYVSRCPVTGSGVWMSSLCAKKEGLGTLCANVE